MYTTSFTSLFLVTGLYKLAMLAFVVGLIFFIAWAIKNLKKDTLFKLSIRLMVAGILICLLVTVLGGGFYKKNKDYYTYGMMGKGMMTWDTCQQKIKSLKDIKSTKATTESKSTTAE